MREAVQPLNAEAINTALLQLVNQWLSFTYSRSPAFRYELVLLSIELTISALAAVRSYLLDNSGDE